MKVTLKDLVTGDTVVGTEGLTLWDWTEGNWSCDCNRYLTFNSKLEAHLEGYFGRNICYGTERIIVIDVEEEYGDFEGLTKQQVINEMNREYTTNEHTITKTRTNDTNDASSAD